MRFVLLRIQSLKTGTVFYILDAPNLHPDSGAIVEAMSSK